MQTTIYTLGYAQWPLEQVASTVEALAAVLVDVRHSPWTSKPGFKKKELEARFEDRYRHISALGNVNYKGGPIELANPDRGIREVRSIDAPVILLCGCKHPETCHRSEVASRLAEAVGGRIEHLRAPSERNQPDLFGGD